MFALLLDRATALRRAGAEPWALFPRRVRTPRAASESLPLTPVAHAQRELEAALVRVAKEPAFVDEITGRLVELGLAQTDSEGVSLTPAGCFWAGNICEIFSLAVRDQVDRP